jgi:hypothetical protein
MARRSVLKLVCQLFRADVLVIEQAARIGALDDGRLSTQEGSVKPGNAAIR